MEKRVVLEYTTGVYAGLKQIVGTVSQLREQMSVAELPAFVPEVQFLDHKGAVNLVRSRRHYVHYREVITPAGAQAQPTFHPDQQ
jgi:hypothetical protein